MLVGLDSRALARTDVRGIGRYLWNLLDAMRAVGRDVRWRLFYDPDFPAPAVPSNWPVEMAPLRCRGDRWRLWEQLALPAKASWAGVDLMHYPGNYAAVVQPTPAVVTVHDTIAWDQPDPAGPSRRFLFRVLPAALRRARRIITISRHARRDIVRRFGFAKNKIRVIGHGLDERFAATPSAEAIDEVRGRLGLTRPYVLYVGGGDARKRADWAIRLLAEWAQTPAGRDLELAMLGLANQSAETLQALARRLGVAERVRVLGYVDADDLPGLYGGSELVVYPTLYEGFGFPALEAQACGKVVLMGRTSSLVELAGPSAELLECEDFEQWRRAGQCWLQRPADRDAIARPARQWARRFNWRDAARATLEVYREAAQREN